MASNTRHLEYRDNPRSAGGSDSSQEIRDLIMEAMIEGGWYEEKEATARE